MLRVSPLMMKGSVEPNFPWLHATNSIRIYPNSKWNRGHHRALPQFPNWWANMKIPVAGSKKKQKNKRNQKPSLKPMSYHKDINTYRSMPKMNTNCQKAKLNNVLWPRFREKNQENTLDITHISHKSAKGDCLIACLLQSFQLLLNEG